VRKLRSKEVVISKAEIYKELEQLLTTPRTNNKKFVFTQEQIDFINKARSGKFPLTWGSICDYWEKLFDEEITAGALKTRVSSNRHIFKF
jgi:hypothetical protein